MGNKSSDERRSGRTNVLLSGTLENDGRFTPVRIANLSANGALVFGVASIDVDSEVTLVCAGQRMRGWIAWSGESHAGINFDEPIDPNAVLPKRHQGGEMIVKDGRDLDFRRPGFKGNQLTAEERSILERWKQELDEK